jgi:hypothetical protein
MKNHLLQTSVLLLLIVIIFSCKKDNPTSNNTNQNPPVVVLNGNAVDSIRLNSAWIDHGATAHDYNGVSLTVISNADSVNPNIHVAGNYTIKYSATDSYNKTGTATRLVVVDSAMDITPPVVTLNGSNPIDISLGAIFTDPGATSFDDVNGAVSVFSNTSNINPNVNKIGVYIITYTAHDAAGNTGTAQRTVRVKNDAENFAGTYDVHDSITGIVFLYSQIITVDSVINNQLHFSLFCDYANNRNIYATKSGNGDLVIPTQTAVNIGSGSSFCDVATHQFGSVNYSATSNGFIITYTDAITAPSSCLGSDTGEATYTRH